MVLEFSVRMDRPPNDRSDPTFHEFATEYSDSASPRRFAAVRASDDRPAHSAIRSRTVMGFLKKFLRNVLPDEANVATGPTSFDALDEEDLETHLQINRYGKFRLTDAVRPSYDLKVTPRQGYRHDTYRDPHTRAQVPVLMASASAELLFELFIELLDPLGNEVDVVIETSHYREHAGHLDLYRERIDLPVLKSLLYDYEDLLLNDGCTGIAVLNPAVPQEVQFDEHKLLICYGEPLGDFERVLQSYRVRPDEEIQFITEAEHVHSSNEHYAEAFEDLKQRLGIDSVYGGPLV